MLYCKTNLIFMENKKRYASTAYIKSQNIGKIQSNTSCICILPIFCDPIQHNGNVSPASVYKSWALASTGRI